MTTGAPSLGGIRQGRAWKYERTGVGVCTKYMYMYTCSCSMYIHMSVTYMYCTHSYYMYMNPSIHYYNSYCRMLTLQYTCICMYMYMYLWTFCRYAKLFALKSVKTACALCTIGTLASRSGCWTVATPENTSPCSEAGEGAILQHLHVCSKSVHIALISIGCVTEWCIDYGTHTSTLSIQFWLVAESVLLICTCTRTCATAL